jgi:capsular polysaccharide biosynthesis protein
MNDEIQLEDFKLSIIALWKNKFFILCTCILTTLVGLLITFNSQPVNVYESDTSVYSAAYNSEQGKNLSTALISYAEIVTSKKVCERAASLLKGDAILDASEINNMIHVYAVNDSVIQVIADSTDPEVSIEVANAVAEAFVREITSITENDAIQILDAADSCILRNNGTRNLFIKRGAFALLGLVASSLYIVITQLASNKLRSVIQCIDEDEDEILGIVPYME